MRLIEAYKKIKDLNLPLFQTSDVSLGLKINKLHGSQILTRLTKEKLIIKLSKGKYAFSEKINPFLLPSFLTYPKFSYISLQSALYYHGMISQIPSVIYAVSLDRTKKIKTPIGVLSIHSLIPDFFFGYKLYGKDNFPMATPEKAILDFFYISPAKTLLFQSLPEIELPKDFNFKLAFEWSDKIPSKQRRTLVRQKLKKLMNRSDVH